MPKINDEQDIATALLHSIYRERAERYGGLFEVSSVPSHAIIATSWNHDSSISITCYPWNFIACWAAYADSAIASGDGPEWDEDAEWASLPEAMEELESPAWEFWQGADPADFDDVSIISLASCEKWAEAEAQYVAMFIQPTEAVQR